MKEYVFTAYLSGIGNDSEDAWEDVLNQLKESCLKESLNDLEMLEMPMSYKCYDLDLEED